MENEIEQEICQFCRSNLKDGNLMLIEQPGKKVHGQWCSHKCFMSNLEEKGIGIKIPFLSLDSKQADKVLRHESVYSRAMHYAWFVGDGQVLVVEDIPENYPRLSVYVTDRRRYEGLVKEHRTKWEEIGTC